MARQREFDTENLLDGVMQCFMQYGLQRTSMRRLEAATGVKQVSLYNAFDSKEGLFLAVFDRYADISTRVQKKYLDRRGLEGIAEFARVIVTPNSPLPYSQYGCLIVNTSLVAESAGPIVTKRVRNFRHRMVMRFLGAFKRARAQSMLKKGLNISQCAELTVVTIWGIFTTIRLAQHDQTVGQPAVKAFCATLRDWSPVGFYK